MITVASAEAAMASVMAEIHVRGFEPAWSAVEIATLVQAPGAFALIAACDQRPAGFIVCRVAADEAEILTIATLPEVRRRGVGSALLAQALSDATTRGARSMFLEVAVDNTAALGLYAARGFREVGRRPRYYARADSVVAAVIMKVELNR